MKGKKYSSFEAINWDLKVLRLQQEIHKEGLSELSAY